MPTRYADLFAIAQDIQHFSSRDVLVAPTDREAPEEEIPEDALRYEPLPGAGDAPPITSDPPVHTWARRLLLPPFSVGAIAKWEPETRDLCRSLIDGFMDTGRADGAADYAQQIPPRVIASMLGIPKDMADTFTGWVRGFLELGLTNPELRQESARNIFTYLHERIEEHKQQPGDGDLITYLLKAEVDGEPVPDSHVLGTCFLLLVAGIDTTWSSIGSALWHLAQHPEDRARLVAEPQLMPTAVEELLRAYSPVTMARYVADEVEYAGCKMEEGDRVLMNFPAGNRDPEVFDEPDKVILDRAKNPHIAFGVGIHRCAGSNLARMEMRVALEEWLARIPDFRLEDPSVVTWAGGQVRGPRSMPVVWP
jgi:cytochrome P450